MQFSWRKTNGDAISTKIWCQVERNCFSPKLMNNIFLVLSIAVRIVSIESQTARQCSIESGEKKLPAQTEYDFSKFGNRSDPTIYIWIFCVHCNCEALFVRITNDNLRKKMCLFTWDKIFSECPLYPVRCINSANNKPKFYRALCFLWRE